jgi:pimeloyl-ACP methyl ester carboxylesterase
MYFHGKPGSRLWCPDEEVTADSGVRLIIPDRPGIGRSDPLEPRMLSHWPSDVEELADALGIGKFAVVGVSGGGPYAAACAALIPGRLTAVAEVSSITAQSDWAERPGVEERWLPRMRTRFALAQTDQAAAVEMAAEHWTTFIEPAWQPELMREELESVEEDRWFFDDADRVAIFDAQSREWWRQGADGVKWDLMDVLLPWGFRLADIAVPVTVFNASKDLEIRQEDVDFEVAIIPHCALVTWTDCGHLGFLKHWREVLASVT